MDPSLPSPSTPPAAPRDTSSDTTKALIAENLQAGGAAGPAIGVATPAATPATQVAQTKPGLWGAIVETFTKFSDDDGMTQAAALAFYTGLALAPLLTVVVWVVSLATPADAKEKVIQVAVGVIGPQGDRPIRQVIAPETIKDEIKTFSAEKIVEATTVPASQPAPARVAPPPPTTGPDDPNVTTAAEASMTLTGIASIIFLAFTASGVLAQLQASLNLIWNVKPDPKKSGIVILIRKRIFSFGMLFTVLFLLLVSMLVTFAVNVVVKLFVSEDLTVVTQLVNVGVTFAIATGVFMLLFTYLPDVKVPWRDTLFGAALTALLFIFGRFAIGQYISRSDYSTTGGAAVGSFLALLVWVYYTSIIMFLGVEATTVFTRRRGHDPKPERHAVRTLRTERVLESGRSVAPA